MKIKEFPKEYIKKGHFRLHSGEVTDTFYDVNAYLTEHIEEFVNKVKRPTKGENVTFVGIATGGAIIASHFPKWAMIKDGELKGEIFDEYYLIDDVVTTERTFVDAINIIGRAPKGYIVVVDRRVGQKFMKIKSLYVVTL